MPESRAVEPWFPPLAPLPAADGTTFRVVCRGTETLFLQLYDSVAAHAPARTLTLDARTNRQGEIWEILVPDVGEGQLYTWAVDPAFPLLDPYSLALAGPTRFGADEDLPPLKEANRGARFKSVVVAPPPPLDWQRPQRTRAETVLYELHVRGFTKADGGGTFRDLAARAPYLRDLGITTVQLLPVHEFDETEVRRAPGLRNFWGYSPIAWLAPQRRYAAAAAEPLGPLHEFREMVRAFHAEGLEVILDVVFNHTGELDSEGPTWSLRGLADDLYYLREQRTGEYMNLTGCGNTVRAQHPTVRAIIRHALRWWVHGMGVDGFRFDLASILARDIHGKMLRRPSLLKEIEEDPWLRETHLIAEAWDAADGYLVGSWPGGPRWAVWNDRFRDDVRRTWLHGSGDASILATRLSGSSDLFAPFGPLRSVNYVTAHDGFTLRDAVSYAQRRNEANAEDNHDGHAHEVSANLGVEGPTEDAGVRAARDRTRRNLVASLLVAQGVPMLLAGDELGRTQRGNNNAYCQDNEISWLDWKGLDEDAAFHRFVRGLIRFRRATPALRRQEFLKEQDVSWFGPDGGAIDWGERAFGFHLKPDVVVLVNLTDAEMTFALPGSLALRLVADTTAAPPGDFIEEGGPWSEPDYNLKAKGLALFRAE